MKKFLLFAILLFVGFAQATTTVTGTMKSLGSSNVTGGFVRFWLRGCAGNQPRISGSGIIAPTLGGVYFFDFPASASGVISGTIYSNRDSTGLLGGDIECGGSLTATWYGMQAYMGGKGGPEVAVYAKNTGTLDVSNVTPITTTPVITAPTGDSTYLRLDAGNLPMTGALFPQVSVPVELFGATGDWNGSTGTDNTTAIQACLNSLTTGVCTLQAKAYKITAALTISKSSVGLIGVGLMEPSSAIFTSVPPASVIITTCASCDILDVSGVSPSNTIGYNQFKNFTLARSVAPTGTASGLSLTYAYGTVIDYVASLDSIRCFYLKGVGAVGVGRLENFAATWGYNGVTESGVSLYGVYVDSAGGVGSPSLRIRNGAVASNLGNPGGGLVTYGLAAVGSLLADLHVFHLETALTNYGVYLNNTGVSISSSTDIHIDEPILDQCYNVCLSINGIVGTVSVVGGWSNPFNPSASPSIDIQSSKNVKVMGHTVFAAGVTGNVLNANTGSGIQLIGNTVFAASGAAIAFVSITSGQIEGNSITGVVATNLINIVGSVDVAIALNSLEGTATNGIVLDSSSHRISGLETNSCGTVGAITNCIVDTGGNGLLLPAQVFANYPACTSALEGKTVAVKDSATATYNNTVTGSGANHILAYCNGTNWVAQ